MTIEEIRAKLETTEYDFLRTNENLGQNIILLTLGGSYAYGTSNENSDIDIRGIATNSENNLYIMKDFEQVVDVETDTTVYSVEKIFKLLCACNPNTIEILGALPEHYLYKSFAGQMLYDNRHIFLSKRAVYSFGGYANAQLRRMENLAIRDIEQGRREQHILNSINHAAENFKDVYFDKPDDSIRLYIDNALNPDFDSEIFMDVSLQHYPLRDYKDMWHEMQAIVKSYNKIGMRNKKAIEHDKLGKHMCHLVRLYFMAFDILESGEIITYRTKEHDFLVDLRNGKYLGENQKPTKEFYGIVDELDAKLKRLAQTTELPDVPDMDAVNRLHVKINQTVV